MRIVVKSKYTNFDFKTTSYVKDLIVSRIFEMLAEPKIYFQPLKNCIHQTMHILVHCLIAMGCPKTEVFGQFP